MFFAAFTSACSACPQPEALRRNTAWLSRFPSVTKPQEEHRCDVYAGFTFTTIVPACDGAAAWLVVPLGCAQRDSCVAGVGPPWMYRGTDHSADLGFLRWLALKRAFF